jgi:Zn-dependent protease with chaperone function
MVRSFNKLTTHHERQKEILKRMSRSPLKRLRFSIFLSNILDFTYNTHMKRTLILWVFLLLGTLLGMGFLRSSETGNELTRFWAWRLLQTRSPGSFQRELRRALGIRRLTAGQLRDVWAVLDQAHHSSFADMTSAEGIRGMLLTDFGYADRGLDSIRRALHSSRVERERFSLLWAKGHAERRSEDFPALASTVAELRTMDCDDEDLEPFLTTLNARGKSREGPLSAATAGGIWGCLILFPIGVILWRSRRFLESRGTPRNDLMAYFSFHRSPLNLLICLFSGILIIGVRLPVRTFGGHSVAWGLASFSLMYLILLKCNHRIDHVVRKTEWAFSRFLAVVLRLTFLHLFFGVVFLVTFFLLRGLAVNLPMWGMRNPLELALAVPAVAGSVILLFPWFLPLFLGLTPWKKDQRPEWAQREEIPIYRWDIPGSRFYNGLAFGYLSVQQAVILTSPLTDTFSSEETRAIFAHERGHLKLQHLFRIFLLLFAGFLVLGHLALSFPLDAQRLLVKGPTGTGVLVLAMWFVGMSSLLRRLLWDCELEADGYAATEVGREPYISALRKLHEENFLPTQWRESDNARISHPPLTMRVQKLREAAGTYLPAAGSPDAGLLVAMWRSRLALEMKAGEADALEILALDDDFHAASGPERLHGLAERHSRYGAEVLLPKEGSVLEVLHCRQKACARSAAPPLPLEKVCLLCRGGSFKALGINGDWREAQDGCVFSFPSSEQSAPS